MQKAAWLLLVPHNSDVIKAGRVAIQKGSVSKLPFADNSFDLVTAVETQYYWPDLIGDMREILRVLKTGGKLIVIAETYKGGKYDKLKWPVMWLLRSSHLSVNAHRELFSLAGYSDVEIFEEQNKGWLCGVALKASPSRSNPDTAMTTDVRTTFVPVDVHNLPVLMCNYTGKEVV